MARSIMSGGGINSNKTVQSRSEYKVEPKTHAGNVAGVAQQGISTAFRKEPITQGKGYEPAAMGTVDRPSYQGPTTPAPGSNRTIYPSGLQSKTPRAREMAPGRDILSEYGRDIPGRGKR